MASARHGARGLVLIVASVVLLGLCAAAQTNSSPANEQKTTPPLVSPPEGRKELIPGGQGSGPVEILSDTMGVDFNPYLQQVFRTVNLNWRILMPESVYPPILKKGMVFIELSVMKDGSLQGMKVVGPPADAALVRAAWGSITNSAPFEPLPSEFKGQYLEIRFRYFYNLNVDGTPATDVSFGISPSGPITVAAGGTRQFSARARASGVAPVNWAIGGDQCGERWAWTAVVIATRSECGDISASGLYRAPDEVPERPEIVITATSIPLKSATTKVSIVAPSSAKSGARVGPEGWDAK